MACSHRSLYLVAYVDNSNGAFSTGTSGPGALIVHHNQRARPNANRE